MASTQSKPAPASSSPLAPALRLFLRVQLLLLLVCALIETFCLVALHLHSPYAYPLMMSAPFPDFILDAANIQFFHQSTFYTFGRGILYPAPMALAYALFFFIGHTHALALFLFFIVASGIIAAVLLGRALQWRGAASRPTARFLAITLLIGFPLWFECKQGNVEICIWALVTLGVWALFRGRGYSAAACFGLAGSMKVYPFVYLGLQLSKRRFREIFFALAVALLATLASLWLTGGTIVSTWHLVNANIGQFRHLYMLSFRGTEIGFDHSLFALYKRFIPHLPPPPRMDRILSLYIDATALAGIALYFLRIRFLPLTNQVLCLSLASVLLPPVSYDYTLLHLYVPWGLLVLFAQERWNARQSIPGLTAAILCFAVVMAPESEFIVHHERFAAQFKAVVMLLLLYIGLKYPFAGPEPITASGGLRKSSPWATGELPS